MGYHILISGKECSEIDEESDQDCNKKHFWEFHTPFKLRYCKHEIQVGMKKL